MNKKISFTNMLVSLAIICSFLGSGVSFGNILGFAILPIRIIGIICALWMLVKCFSDANCRLNSQFIVFAYIYMILVSLLFTENYMNSISLLLDYLCLFSIFCVLFIYSNNEYDYRKYTNLFLICISITIAICFYEYFTQHHIARNYTEAFSTSEWAYSHTIKAPTAFLYNPNNVAVLMLIALPLMFEKLSEQRERSKRVIWLVLTFLDYAVILMTGSRGGFIAGVITTVVFFLSSNIKLWKKTIFIICSILLVLVFSGFIYNQFAYGGMLNNGAFSLFVEGDGGRSNIAKTALENVFVSNPLFGSGAGSLENHHLQSAHNTIIEVLCNYGIIGCVIFAFLLFRMFKKLLFQNGKIISILLFLSFFMSMFIPPTIMTIYVIFIPLALRVGRSNITVKKDNYECINNN